MPALTLDPPEASRRVQTDTDAAREALEDILEARDQGPFITITDMKALREDVMAKVRERLQQQSSHA
jgi:hypothetical protein